LRGGPELTPHSAWWGESFVTELRRISETSERKVRFDAATTSKPDDSSKTEGATSSEHPLRQELTIPERAKESEPSAAVDATKDAEAPAASIADDLPSQPTHAVTQ
jgi:trehalose 6-phosphate synthase